MARPKNEEVNEIETEEVTKVKKKFDGNEGILCRSVTQGGLFMDGIKTGMNYSWTDYGDETEVEYKDLVAAIRAKTSYIFTPRFIIEDEDFIEEFPQLKKFYDERYTVKDLRSILKMPVNEMIKTIKELPESSISSLKLIAAKQVGDGTIDSVKKIKALDEIFGTELNLINEIINN